MKIPLIIIIIIIIIIISFGVSLYTPTWQFLFYYWKWHDRAHTYRNILLGILDESNVEFFVWVLLPFSTWNELDIQDVNKITDYRGLYICLICK